MMDYEKAYLHARKISYESGCKQFFCGLYFVVFFIVGVLLWGI